MMKRGFFLVFLLKTLFFLVCYAAQPCAKRSSCACETDDGRLIDLSSLAKGDTFAFGYSPATEYPDQYLYAWNPCIAITESSGDCINAASCRKDSESSITVGTQDTADFDTTGANIVLKYQAPSPKGVLFDVWVELICNPEQEEPIFNVDGDIIYLVYQYTLTSKCCCPDGCKGGSGGGGDGKSGLSFGSILCILFSCLLIVFLVAGALYMQFGRKVEAKEVTPNYSVWVQDPVLVKDGGKFT